MGEWAELSFGTRRQLAGGVRERPALRKELRPGAAARPILEREKRKFLEESTVAARCCLGLDTCLPCVATRRVGVRLTHSFPLVLQHSAWQCCSQSPSCLEGSRPMQLFTL